MSTLSFDQTIANRHSNRKFDPNAPVPEAVMQKGLEHATLAPNSSNMQCWEFIWVHDQAKRAELSRLCLGQQAASSAQELVVFVTRQDWWKKRVEWHKELIAQDEAAGKTRGIALRKKYYSVLMPMIYRRDVLGLSTLVRRGFSFFAGLRKPMYRASGRAGQRIMLHKTCALAAQNFMMSMSAQGFDTCPMEGFDEKRVKRMLQLPRAAEVCMIVSVGKGLPEGKWTERRRVPIEEVVRKV